MDRRERPVRAPLALKKGSSGVAEREAVDVYTRKNGKLRLEGGAPRLSCQAERQDKVPPLLLRTFLEPSLRSSRTSGLAEQLRHWLNRRQLNLLWTPRAEGHSSSCQPPDSEPRALLFSTLARSHTSSRPFKSWCSCPACVMAFFLAGSPREQGPRGPPLALVRRIPLPGIPVPRRTLDYLRQRRNRAGERPLRLLPLSSYLAPPCSFVSSRLNASRTSECLPSQSKLDLCGETSRLCSPLITPSLFAPPLIPGVPSWHLCGPCEALLHFRSHITSYARLHCALGLGRS